MFGSNSAGDNSFCAKRQPFDIVTGPLTVKTIAFASSSTKHHEGGEHDPQTEHSILWNKYIHLRTLYLSFRK